MIKLAELKKLNLNIRRTFKIEIESVVSKNSPNYYDREGIEVRMYPVLHIAAYKGGFSEYGEDNFVAALSCETEDISFFIGTTFDIKDLESSSWCNVEKIMYLEKGELPVFYKSLYEACRDYDKWDEYDRFFSNLLWEKAEEYKENMFLHSGCEEWSDAIMSAVQNAIMNADDDNERRILSEVFVNSLS